MKIIQEAIERQLYDGAEILVARHGKILFHEALGFAERKTQRPLEKGAVFSIYSIAKALTATRLLDQIASTNLSLKTPVSDLLVEFQGKGKGKVTLWHLLTHTGGISSGLPSVPFEELGNLKKVVTAICKEELAFLLGEVHYSPVCGFALLGEVLCRTDPKKRSFQKIMEEDLFKPLFMKDSFFGLRTDLLPRIVPVVFRDKTPGIFPKELVEKLALLFTPDSEIPGGGCLSTAFDLFLFTEALKKKKWLKEAIQNQTQDLPNDLWAHARAHYQFPIFPAFLGLGFWLRGKGCFPTPFGQKASAHTFGAVGLGSTLFFVDLETDLTCVCLTSGLMEESHSIQRFEQFSDAAHRLLLTR